jgi:hypothetical protein
MPRKKKSPPLETPPSQAAVAAGGETGESPPSPSRPVDLAGAQTVLLAILQQLAGHRPSDALTLLLRQQLPEDKALADGQRVSPDRVLSDALYVLPPLVPVLLEAPLPGYGPRRAYYTVSLALDLSQHHRGLRTIETSKAGASRVKTTTTLEGDQQRQLLVRHLDKITRVDVEHQAKLAKASAYNSRRPSELGTSLQLLAGLGRELLAEVQARPELGELYADAGFDESLIVSAEAESQQLYQAIGTHGVRISERSVESDALNILEGRLQFELEMLVQAAEDGRRRGRAVPTVRLAQLHRSRNRRKPPAEQPPTPSKPSEKTPAAPVVIRAIILPKRSS